MARTVEIIAPPERTAELSDRLRGLRGLINLKLMRGASVEPPGDAFSVPVSNRHLQELMRLLDSFGLGREGGVSSSSSEPDSVISQGDSYRIDLDSNEAAWEEMEMIISKGSNAHAATLLLMAAAGCLAVVGIVTSALHVVIGGMLLAPGFMPVIRIPLGVVARHPCWRRGVTDTLKGYAVLVFAAALTSVALQWMGYDIIAASTSYHVMEDRFINYWTTITGSSLLSSAAASLGGAILIATKRSIFASGVMIGLALIPSAAIIGMGLVTADLVLMAKAFSRFSVDIGLVLTIPLLFFAWERHRVHRRDMRL
jgi:hypothetical protein